jgi:hypothetical protein
MLTCEGDKFVVARWMYSANLASLQADGVGDLEDESIVKLVDVAVLRNCGEINKLSEQIQIQIEEFYHRTADKSPGPDADPNPHVYTWHIDGMHKALDCPYRMVLFRGEEEVCVVYFEQVAPIA